MPKMRETEREIVKKGLKFDIEWLCSYTFICLGDSAMLNPLSPNIKIQILLSCPHTFLIDVEWRSCDNFKRIHLG